jgi:hypothetical protein
MLVWPGPEQASILHQLADADIFAAVLAGIADPDHASVRLQEPSRALDLQEEEFDRIRRPGDFQAPPRERSVLDRGAVVIGNHDSILEPAAPRRSGCSGSCRIDFDEIGGPAIDRHVVARQPGPRSGNLRLEITSDEAFARADFGGFEMTFEEGGGCCIRPGSRGVTGRPPILGLGETRTSSRLTSERQDIRKALSASRRVARPAQASQAQARAEPRQ